MTVRIFLLSGFTPTRLSPISGESKSRLSSYIASRESRDVDRFVVFGGVLVYELTGLNRQNLPIFFR